MRSPRLNLTLTSVALAAAAVTTPARADQLALDRFEPAPAGDRMFGVESPGVPGHLSLKLSLLADYAHKPLLLRTVADRMVIGGIVRDQLFFHVNASVALWNRVNLSLNIPAAIYQKGDSPSGNGVTYAD